MKAIISGASRGIGKAISMALAKAGYDLILLARSQEDLKQLEDELNQKFQAGKIETIVVDLAETKSFDLLAEELKDHSTIDMLVNNVGLYEMNSATEINRAELKQMIDINLYSAIELTQLLLEKIKKSESGIIVNIGSVMSLKSAPFAANYSISKHAFKGWNDALREELRSEKIKVSAFYPGAVNTSSWDGMEANREAMIQAEDIAELVSLLPRLSKSCLLEELRISPLQF